MLSPEAHYTNRKVFLPKELNLKLTRLSGRTLLYRKYREPRYILNNVEVNKHIQDVQHLKTTNLGSIIS